MLGEHARPCIPHHLAHSFPGFRPVAVDRAVGAGGFVGPVRTEIETAVGVVGQLFALLARPAGAVVIGTVHLDHRPHRLALSCEPSKVTLHSHSVARRVAGVLDFGQLRSYSRETSDF